MYPVMFCFYLYNTPKNLEMKDYINVNDARFYPVCLIPFVLQWLHR